MAQYLEYGIAGRTAIVTGGGTGIGRAHGHRAAKADAKLALFGRRPEKLEETKNECLRYTPNVMAVSVDISDKTSAEAAVKQVAEAFGPVTILVNNAGIESRISPAKWRSTTILTWSPTST